MRFGYLRGKFCFHCESLHGCLVGIIDDEDMKNIWMVRYSCHNFIKTSVGSKL